MNYLYAFTMLLILVLMGLFSMLGLQYVYEGHGLHPYLAGLGFIVSFAIGLYTAYQCTD